MSIKSKILEFDSRNSMLRFILLYRDLFVPYSDDVIRCKSYVQDIPTYKTKNGNLYSRGHHDNCIIAMMEQGYRIVNNNILEIHMNSDDFKICEEMFEKINIQRGKYKYVFKVA